VLGPDALGDLDHAPVGVEGGDPSVGHEHGPQLEADEAVDPGPDGGQGGHPALVVEGVEAVRREHDGGGAPERHRLGGGHVGVEGERVAGLVGHVGAGHELAPGDGGGQVEHPFLVGTAQELHVAGVHVHRRHQSGGRRPGDVGLGGRPVDGARIGVGHQHGGHAGDLPAGPDPQVDIGGHRGHPPVVARPG
jgi:hypothetical protein